MLFSILFLVSTSSLSAQSPCRDTIVNVYDSICEGGSYDFNGRIVNYTGLFFDTLPRVGTTCDSIILLRLTVLDTSELVLYPKTNCTGVIGYDIYSSGFGDYYEWSSEPFDSALQNQLHEQFVRVNPQVPTTYYLTVDYRPTPQCPSRGSKEVIPVLPVEGSMKVWPDEITLDQMEFTVKDMSLGSHEYHWGGWSGRKWFINGVRQEPVNNTVTFAAEPWWDDTVQILMIPYSPTCFDSVIRLLPFKKIALYIPNVFAPGQEDNSLFTPVLTGVTDFEIWIFDRRGTQVFYSDSPDCSWDGTNRGVPCPTGTYVYRCRYRDVVTPEGYQSRIGTVTLVR